ncbi:unnamed protein product [Phyllotreta striolata]|uniref:AFP-like domain-containing protein n=1 Tax=Phyllotreta striolata TaxID=444603 RepID=A0A9N9TQP0_PHYSR|nr:unnamed protein product [Phyllotreta striolata]
MDFSKLKKTFVIAEIGQNHQGSLDTAKYLIKTAKDCGADCVKFQKSDIHEKFNKSALSRPYESPHSFGLTYGEHKRFLEFSEEEYRQLKEYACELGILFTASAMDVNSLDFLINLGVPFIKIGSGDANNYLLIEKAARSGIPLVVSTGMQGWDTVKEIHAIISKWHNNFALLHCISSYPTPLAQINLNCIKLYQSEFPDTIVGYSGHELGVHVIERHITLDKTQKGSDHKCSLDPKEFEDLVKGIRSVEMALGEPIKKFQECEKSCYEKLGKTLVYRRNLRKNHIVRRDDLNVKVAEPKGIDGAVIDDIIGKSLRKDVEEDQSVLSQDFL